MKDTNKVVISGVVQSIRDSRVEKLGGVRVLDFVIRSRDDGNYFVNVECTKWDASNDVLFEIHDRIEVTGKLVNRFKRHEGDELAKWSKCISVESVKMLEKYVENKNKAIDRAVEQFKKI